MRYRGRSRRGYKPRNYRSRRRGKGYAIRRYSASRGGIRL